MPEEKNPGALAEAAARPQVGTGCSIRRNEDRS
jgi:hypothetical protein